MNKQITTDEKFISIEYETWVNKYLPMEEENESLKRKVEASEIQVNIVLKNAGYNYSYDRRIGFIDIEIKKGWNVKIDNFSEVENKIRDLIQLYKPYSIVSAKEEISKYEELIKEYEKSFNRNVLLVNKIPKIIRWLFRIK